MKNMRRRTQEARTDEKPDLETVKKAKFRKLTFQPLTDEEKEILKRWDFLDGEVLPAPRYEKVSAAENRRRKAAGLPPRVLKKDDPWVA
jgi:hypothetical protein